ncbi:MAG TPA: peptidoglycan DD-metalloendopeptidase family protein, partial [Actinomycetota bacterium]|nr:peptidoglycan DD-metalloendopeptidase family protein [Actinomycetota bacterium]
MRRLLLPLLVLLVVLPAPSARAGEWRQIHFPVAGPVTYTDDFGDPRSGGRTHTGIDIMGAKLQHLIAAAGGRVSYIRTDSSGTSGNMLTIRDSAGWQYTYVHVNNDSPGTDDNANPAQWIFTPGISLGATVT